MRAARDAVADDIDAALDQKRQLDARIAELVELAERLTAQVGDDELPDSARRAGESRVDAVHRALLEAGEPLNPQQVQEALARSGRDESRKDVSSALSYLATKGRVRRVGDAQWRAG